MLQSNRRLNMYQTICGAIAIVSAILFFTSCQSPTALSKRGESFMLPDTLVIQTIHPIDFGIEVPERPIVHSNGSDNGKL